MLVAVVRDYVKPLTRGSEITYAWTYTELTRSTEAATLAVQRVNDVQVGTASALIELHNIISSEAGRLWQGCYGKRYKHVYGFLIMPTAKLFIVAFTGQHWRCFLSWLKRKLVCSSARNIENLMSNVSYTENQQDYITFNSYY